MCVEGGVEGGGGWGVGEGDATHFITAESSSLVSLLYALLSRD